MFPQVNQALIQLLKQKRDQIASQLKPMGERVQSMAGQFGQGYMSGPQQIKMQESSTSPYNLANALANAPTPLGVGDDLLKALPLVAGVAGKGDEVIKGAKALLGKADDIKPQVSGMGGVRESILNNKIRPQDEVELFHGSPYWEDIINSGKGIRSGIRRNTPSASKGGVYVSDDFNRALGFSQDQPVAFKLKSKYQDVLPDTDTLKNMRSVGENVKNTVEDSILKGSSAKLPNDTFGIESVMVKKPNGQIVEFPYEPNSPDLINKIKQAISPQPIEGVGKVENLLKKRYSTNKPIGEYTGFLTTEGKKIGIDPVKGPTHRMVLNEAGIPGTDAEAVKAIYGEQGGIRIRTEGREINIQLGKAPTSQQMRELEKLPEDKLYHYDFMENGKTNELPFAEDAITKQEFLNRVKDFYNKVKKK